MAAKPTRLNKGDIDVLMQDKDVKTMRELFPPYTDGDVIYDLQTLAQYAESGAERDKSARLASTMVVRILPLVQQSLVAKRKIKGTPLFDGAVMVAGYGAMLYLLHLAGVIQFTI